MFTGDEPLTGRTSGISAGKSAAAKSAAGAAPGRRDPIPLDSISRALEDIAAGKAVVVVDDEDRENEGDIIFAAEKATTELVAFTVRYSSGYLCVPLPGAECDRLGLPPMFRSNEDPHSTAYTVTVDARHDTTTGISARDRATTIRRLADPSSEAADFTRPGHVVPLRARPGGVLERAGHTEAAIDLTRLAGLHPAGVVCEIVSEQDPQGMARTPELRAFADEHELALISIADLAAWRNTHETLVARGPEAAVPTVHGQFRAIGYTGVTDEREHVALIAGGRPGSRPITGRGGSTEPVPVRIHSECLTGDVFGSLRCSCGNDLGSAMDTVAARGYGVVLYLRGDGAGGEGLVHRLRGFTAHSTGDAPTAPGARDLSVVAQILGDLGVRRVELLTCPSDGPAVADVNDSLAAHGITVTGHTPIAAGSCRVHGSPGSPASA